MTTDFKAISPTVFRDLAHAAAWQQRALSAHQTLDATAIKGPSTGANFAMNTGLVTVTGSLIGMATGLSIVAQVFVSISNADIATALYVTARVSPTDVSKIDIYVWRPTNAGTTTPIAGTGPLPVNWLAIGTQGPTPSSA